MTDQVTPSAAPAQTANSIHTPPAPAVAPHPAVTPAAPAATTEASAEAELEKPKTQAELEAEELASLKKRAQMMGLTVSNNISIPTLKAKIQEKIDNDSKPAEAPVKQPNPLADTAVEQRVAEARQAEPEQAVEADPNRVETKMERRARILAENMRLVRIRVTNLDPKKKDLQGEILTVANEIIGSVKKFIPYGEATDNGYHVPYVLLKAMQKRRFLDVRTRRDPRTGTNIVEQRWVREFAIEILDPLTEQELRELATAQVAAGSLDNQA